MKPAWLTKNMHFFYRLVICLFWVFFKIFYRVKIYGREHYIKGKGILAANHASFLDPPLIAISWPEEIHFLARKTLFKPFLFGHIIKALNTHPIHGNASDVVVFKLINKLLEEGEKVILFPEGSRSFDGKLQPIKPGVGLLVSKSKAPIIPTFLSGTFEAWDRKRRLPKLFGVRCRCVFGSPIYWEEFSHLDRKEMKQALADRLSETFLNLKTWLESGAKGTPP